MWGRRELTYIIAVHFVCPQLVGSELTRSFQVWRSSVEVMYSSRDGLVRASRV